jgi:hypothetical protein
LTSLHTPLSEFGHIPHTQSAQLSGTEVAKENGVSEGAMMSLVRLISFTTLACGCVTGKYREIATHREVIYVEEKGGACAHHGHRRNHTLAPARFGATVPMDVARAS